MRLGVVGMWILAGGLSYIITARLMGTFEFKDIQKFFKNQSVV